MVENTLTKTMLEQIARLEKENKALLAENRSLKVQLAEYSEEEINEAKVFFEGLNIAELFVLTLYYAATEAEELNGLTKFAESLKSENAMLIANASKFTSDDFKNYVDDESKDKLNKHLGSYMDKRVGKSYVFSKPDDSQFFCTNKVDGPKGLHNCNGSVFTSVHNMHLGKVVYACNACGAEYEKIK